MTTPATAIQKANEEKFGAINGKILSQFNRFMRVSVVALNQWAMDFDGNLKRVIECKFQESSKKILVSEGRQQFTFCNFRLLSLILVSRSGY